MTSQHPLADVGVIGGSGFYSLLDDAETVSIDTPYGPAAGDLTIGELGGKRVAFLPRHGTDHRFPPHNVPYRANLWALKKAGVKQIVTGSAVGSLKAEYGPGTLVVPDQIVDRTWGRPWTYVPDDNGVAHAPFADPYDAAGRAAAKRGAEKAGIEIVDGGTLVVINGPRFSSRAESLDYQRAGYTIVGMTGMPEAVLARELALPFTALALVTDHDAGVGAGEGVTHHEVLEQFAANLPKLRDLLEATIAQLSDDVGGSEAATIYDAAPPPFDLP